VIDVPQRSCFEFTGASRDRNSGITGATYSQVHPFLSPEALNMYANLDGRCTARVIHSGDCRWRKREARITYATPGPPLPTSAQFASRWY
jgi:hypothetical protein